MIHLRPTTLEGDGIRLEPLRPEHEEELRAAASDGELWRLWYSWIPEPDQFAAYIAAALAGQEQGHMLPWAVRELQRGVIVGSTRYHDIIREIDRVEIGYTWYASRWQRTHVNTVCKILLFQHEQTMGPRIGVEPQWCKGSWPGHDAHTLNAGEQKVRPEKIERERGREQPP